MSTHIESDNGKPDGWDDAGPRCPGCGASPTCAARCIHPRCAHPDRADRAALAAAAPELYAACQELIRICSKRDGTLAAYGDWLQCFMEDGSTITGAVTMAVAAVAKVEEAQR